MYEKTCAMPLKALALIVLLLAAPAIAQQPDGSDSAPSNQPDSWVAKRGGQVLTLEDIDAHIAHLPREVRAGFIDSPTRIQKLVDDLLINRQVAEAARQRGLDRSPHYQGMLRLLEEQLLGSLLTAELRDGVTPEDVELAAVERYAMAPAAKYGTPEVRHLRQILVESKNQGAARARESVARARERLLAGEDFDTVALAHSIDVGRTGNDGLPRAIGATTIDALSAVPENVREAVFALQKPGDISEPVESQFGLHIFVLLKIEPETVPPYEQVKAAVLKDTEEWMRRTRVETYVSGLRNTPLDANEATISTLRARYVNGEVPASAQ